MWCVQHWSKNYGKTYGCNYGETFWSLEQDAIDYLNRCKLLCPNERYAIVQKEMDEPKVIKMGKVDHRLGPIYVCRK